MAVENGKCINCGAPLLLNLSSEKGECRFCGSEFLLERAVEKITTDGVAVFDRLLLAAQTAIDLDGDYDKARNKYREALDICPDDYRVYWGLFLCESDAIAWYIRHKGFIQFPGDVRQNVENAVSKYALRAELYAPDDKKEYYRVQTDRIVQRLLPSVASPAPKKKGFLFRRR